MDTFSEERVFGTTAGRRSILPITGHQLLRGSNCSLLSIGGVGRGAQVQRRTLQTSTSTLSADKSLLHWVSLHSMHSPRAYFTAVKLGTPRTIIEFLLVAGGIQDAKIERPKLAEGIETFDLRVPTSQWQRMSAQRFIDLVCLRKNRHNAKLFPVYETRNRLQRLFMAAWSSVTVPFVTDFGNYSRFDFAYSGGYRPAEYISELLIFRANITHISSQGLSKSFRLIALVESARFWTSLIICILLCLVFLEIYRSLRIHYMTKNGPEKVKKEEVRRPLLHLNFEGHDLEPNFGPSWPEADSDTFACHTSASLTEQLEKHVGDLNSPLTPTSDRATLQYKLTSEIGQGSYGIVYAAVQRGGGLLAVKVLPIYDSMQQEDIAIIARETKLMKSLPPHPNIVQYYGCNIFPEKAEIHIVMEFAEGGTLGALCRRQQLDISVIQKFTTQLLMGLSHLHAHQVSHCDVKADNILLSSRGTLKLADFGHARIFATHTVDNQLCSYNEKHTTNPFAKHAFGTLPWTAPELLVQWKGKDLLPCSELKAKNPSMVEYSHQTEFKAVVENAGLTPTNDFTTKSTQQDYVKDVNKNDYLSAKVDVWSVGCTVVEMLNSGEAPWPSTDSLSNFITMVTQSTGLPPTISSKSLPPILNNFLLKCFERDPERRPDVDDLLMDPFITKSERIESSHLEKYNIFQDLTVTQIRPESGSPQRSTNLPSIVEHTRHKKFERGSGSASKIHTNSQDSITHSSNHIVHTPTSSSLSDVQEYSATLDCTVYDL